MTDWCHIIGDIIEQVFDKNKKINTIRHKFTKIFNFVQKCVIYFWHLKFLQVKIIAVMPKGENMKRNIENEIWGKTLLSLYRHLGAISNSIDNLIKRIGINSAFNHSVYNSAYVDSNKIIELTERKIKIINLKVLIEKALDR